LQYSYALDTSSDNVYFDLKKKVCILSGNAVIIYDERTKFRADEIVVSYKKGGDLNYSSARASGNVRFDRPEFTVKSNECECDAGTIKFRGMVLIRGDDFGEIRADCAVYDLNTKRICITSKKGVVAKLHRAKS
jgi:lipopolysaccharide export system protein LptA